MSGPARDTIYALSSGRLPAAIAVVRVSGPRAGDALKALAGRLPEPRKAMLTRLRHPETGDLLDEALALWFPGPRSETGEDTVELQLHGGRAVVAATFAALASLDGLRMAEAGEFTRRAFENGQLDLTRVEGLADLVSADSDAQRRQALRQLRGLLGDRAEGWRQRLIEALALMEAQIDFPDEDDVPQDLTARALALARSLRDEIAGVLASARRGERLREGFVVAISGPPNVGKSSLLNRLARREAAIVSPFAGTTRDVIEVHLDLDGYPVVLLDTAGIRDSDDPVEQEGIRRARARAAEADLVLWMSDATEAARGSSDGAWDGDGTGAAAATGGAVSGGPDARGPQEAGTAAMPGGSGLTGRVAGAKGAPRGAAADVSRGAAGDASRAGSGEAYQAVEGSAQPADLDQGGLRAADAVTTAGIRGISADGDTAAGGPREIWRVFNKADLLKRNEIENLNHRLSNLYNSFLISSLREDGVAALLDALARRIAAFFGAAEVAMVTRERQRLLLQETVAHLEHAPEGSGGKAEELVAEDLRLAARALGRLVGRVDVEDLLDAIFRDFCIGK
ncbi:MAG TPA: tRNA uridine-5-carboxymethylaminomethyl(34) synthesis GTPase MnmE [Xanthobacteraceae bacterium]|nr:tRNA uridine-5-carboxymethylaminomethyl(34) synthesis GTPase MnmE [Xanthobacteraceae bacterium]